MIAVINGIFSGIPIEKKEIRVLLLTTTVWLIALVLFAEDVDSTLLEYWPIVFIAIVSSAVANATAIGGGFIFLPLFSLLYGLTPIVAMKLALATQAFGMSSGALTWPERLILWRYAVISSVSGGVGMTLGTFFWVASNASVNLYFGWVSLILGGLFIREQLLNKKAKKAPVSHAVAITKFQLFSFMVICLLSGLITAWASIGIGEVVALWLMLYLRQDVASAVATGVVSLAFCSILGILFHSVLGGIPWHYLLFTAPGVVIGGRLGAKMGYKLSEMSSSKSGVKLQVNPLKAVLTLVIIVDGVFMLLHHKIYNLT